MRNIDFAPYLTMSPSELRKLQYKKGWALSFVGLIVYGVLKLFGQAPKSYKGICPYFELGRGWGGVAMGWFFICGKGCGDPVKQHEVGHCIQNAAVGGLRMLAYSSFSVARYWYREAFGIRTPYDTWFFEGDATRLGAEYMRTMENAKKE